MMKKKLVEIEENFIKREDLSRRKFYILKNIATHQNIVIKMHFVMIKKNSYSWPWDIKNKN